MHRPQHRDLSDYSTKLQFQFSRDTFSYAPECAYTKYNILGTIFAHCTVLIYFEAINITVLLHAFLFCPDIGKSDNTIKECSPFLKF